jgi:hypothetical protein
MVRLTRRSLITGLISLVITPAIVRASSLMPVRGVPLLVADDIVWTATDFGASDRCSMVTYRAGEIVAVRQFGPCILIEPGKDFSVVFGADGVVNLK